MNILLVVLMAVCVSSTQSSDLGQRQAGNNPPVSSVVKIKSGSGFEVMTEEEREAARLKFKNPWPEGLLNVYHAIALRRPSDAKSALEWTYQELALHETDSREWKHLWFEYRVGSCLLADYEGRISERNRWLEEFTADEPLGLPSVLAPLALEKKITQKSYKLSDAEIAEFASIQIDSGPSSQYFMGRNPKEIRDPRVWAAVAAIRRYKNSMRGLADVHAMRLWKLDKKQSLTAYIVGRLLMYSSEPGKAVEMVEQSLPYAPEGRVRELLVSIGKNAESRLHQQRKKAGQVQPKNT